MKKILISLILALLILPTIFALDLEVEKKSTDMVMIRGLTEPIVFDLEITNNGPTDTFRLYNLQGFLLNPNKGISINGGDTKELELFVSAVEPLQMKGLYQLNIYFRNPREEEFPESLLFRIVDLNETLEITPKNINPRSEEIVITIKNKVNLDFENLKLSFKSKFFNSEKTISIDAKETKEIKIPLNKEDFKDELAGYSTLETEMVYKGLTQTVESRILFSEQDLLEKTESDFGIVVKTTKITKTNTGNVVIKSPTEIKKDIISRLFTSFSPTPDLVERHGLFVYYKWDQEILPGQEKVITVKTNWILPIILIILVIVVVILAKRYSIQNLVLRKKTALVRTKGGEFALKISISADARRDVEKVTVSDKLPSFVRLYENYGTESPKRVDEKNKRLEWSFEEIRAGQSKVVSYIVYSKIGFLGKFVLPTAKAVYERKGKIHEIESNRVYFLTEQKKE